MYVVLRDQDCSEGRHTCTHTDAIGILFTLHSYPISFLSISYLLALFLLALLNELLWYHSLNDDLPVNGYHSHLAIIKVMGLWPQLRKAWKTLTSIVYECPQILKKGSLEILTKEFYTLSYIIILTAHKDKDMFIIIFSPMDQAGNEVMSIFQILTFI